MREAQDDRGAHWPRDEIGTLRGMLAIAPGLAESETRSLVRKLVTMRCDRVPGEPSLRVLSTFRRYDRAVRALIGMGPRTEIAPSGAGGE